MRQKRFYPDYLLEILLVVFVCFEVVLVVSLLFPSQIGRQIDFGKVFLPLPEWYFYWLFELVKYFRGHLAFVGNVLIPLTMLVLLAGIPYIDRRYGRAVAVVVFCLLLTSVLALTLFNIYSRMDF